MPRPDRPTFEGDEFIHRADALGSSLGEFAEAVLQVIARELPKLEPVSLPGHAGELAIVLDLLATEAALLGDLQGEWQFARDAERWVKADRRRRRQRSPR